MSLKFVLEEGGCFCCSYVGVIFKQVCTVLVLTLFSVYYIHYLCGIFVFDLMWSG